jgi:hypothetical protein
MACLYLETVISCLTGQEKSCLVLNIGGIGIDVDVHEGGHGHEKGNVTGGTLCFVVVQFGVGVDNGSDGR